MAHDEIVFRLNGEERRVRDCAPTKTLLQYLREDERLCGTKEGCAEGDCGACTVTVASLGPDGAVKREAINSCIRFLPSLHGTSVTTVEALSDNVDNAHPVQKLFVDHHASQCGFCTPGFVMSLYTAYRNREDLSHQAACDTLAGNLCRCTGYGPILAAAADIGALAAQAPESAEDIKEREGLLEIRPTAQVTIEAGEATAYLPTNSDELAAACLANPDATIVAGATDIGLWVTKQHRVLRKAIFLHLVDDLKYIEAGDDGVTIGAGASYADAIDVLGEVYPDLGELIRRIGARQVRNAGTIGGNIANGSPIGDMPPALIALGATLRLRRGGDRRELPLEAFFLEYGKQDLREGEFVEAIFAPRLKETSLFRCYKISKRFDQDISALCGAFHLGIRDGAVRSARIAFGGMAGVPKCASAVEKALTGNPWTKESVLSASECFEDDFEPLSDMRASAPYRMAVAKNLLMKCFVETSGDFSETRLVGAGSRF